MACRWRVIRRWCVTIENSHGGIDWSILLPLACRWRVTCRWCVTCSWSCRWSVTCRRGVTPSTRRRGWRASDGGGGGLFRNNLMARTCTELYALHASNAAAALLQLCCSSVAAGVVACAELYASHASSSNACAVRVLTRPQDHSGVGRSTGGESDGGSILRQQHSVLQHSLLQLLHRAIFVFASFRRAFSFATCWSHRQGFQKFPFPISGSSWNLGRCCSGPTNLSLVLTVNFKERL